MSTTPPTQITGPELRLWRESRGYSLRELAEKLGVKSPSTVKEWEAGQEIPEVPQKVLRWLIRGEVPFDSESPAAELGNMVRDDIGDVQMTVDAFEECLRRSREAGFASVTEWIAHLVREELAVPVEEKPRRDVRYK